MILNVAINPALADALAKADRDEVLLRAYDHADWVMRRYFWRGFRPSSSTKSAELMVGDKTAKDFVHDALRRFCEGIRSYDPAKSLLENLNSATDSLIWSEKKTSDRTPLVDYAKETTEEGIPIDPLSTAVDPDPSPSQDLVTAEVLEAQENHFKNLLASFDGDKDMQEYLEALSAGVFDLSEIEQLTNLKKSQIYELRRKLKDYAPGFFGVQDFQELKRKIMKGEAK